MRITPSSARAHRPAPPWCVLCRQVGVHPRKALLFLALFLPSPLSPSGALATEWYVDDSVEESGDRTSWETAFRRIQEGIDAASDGDTVVAAEGTYLENVHFNGKNITLRTTDPLDPDVVANTIIDGNQWGSVVSFSGTEDETCTLSGFTVRNGRSERGAGLFGGDLYRRAKATIEANVIDGNSATNSGGVAFCDGVIRANRVTNNTATYEGGGLYGCNGEITGNAITDNDAKGAAGGGVIDGTTYVKGRL